MSDKDKVVDEQVDDLESEDTGIQLSPEEFDALSAKAKLADKHEAELKRMEEERKAQEAEQKAAELRSIAESYTALPVEIDEFVAQMTALESADADSAAWVQTQFEVFDKALEEAGVLGELGTDEEGEDDAGEAFLAIVDKTLTEEFDGDRGRYAEALLKASEDHPELAKYA
jgi:hypothetical protein